MCIRIHIIFTLSFVSALILPNRFICFAHRHQTDLFSIISFRISICFRKLNYIIFTSVYRRSAFLRIHIM